MSNPNLVFVVDDDPGMLKGIERLLRMHGYDSRLFPSAEAFENHNDFEQATCIILDINLNGASGIELRHRLKDAGVSVPIIYITGNDKPECSRGGVEIRMHRIFDKALLGAVADRAAQESIGITGTCR